MNRFSFFFYFGFIWGRFLFCFWLQEMDAVLQNPFTSSDPENPVGGEKVSNFMALASGLDWIGLDWIGFESSCKDRFNLGGGSTMVDGWSRISKSLGGSLKFLWLDGHESWKIPKKRLKFRGSVKNPQGWRKDPRILTFRDSVRNPEESPRIPFRFQAGSQNNPERSRNNPPMSEFSKGSRKGRSNIKIQLKMPKNPKGCQWNLEFHIQIWLVKG